MHYKCHYISIAAGIFGKLFGLYPVESVVTAGMCNNSMGGTGNVAVLSSAKRMELIAFAQMGNRLGGAIYSHYLRISCSNIFIKIIELI